MVLLAVGALPPFIGRDVHDRLGVPVVGGVEADDVFGVFAALQRCVLFGHAECEVVSLGSRVYEVNGVERGRESGEELR